MRQEELDEILHAHKKWLESGGEEGLRADLRGANLRGANLSYADLRGANLRGADLSYADLRGADLSSANLRGADLRGANLSSANLRGADLRGANLSYADLRNADLRNADLRSANLCGADLRGANLSGADLSGANMDYAVLPLWCGGLCMHVDDRIGIQLLYHAVKNILFSKNTSAWLKKAVSCKAILNAVNKFHRVDECGEIEAYRKAG